MAFPRVRLTGHLPPDSIYTRYISCTDGTERKHWKAIWFLSRTTNPLSVKQAALQLGCTSDWVRKLVRRYNADGPAGLLDARRKNGARRLLSPGYQQQLAAALSRPPVGGGRWTGVTVAAAMSSMLGRPVSPVVGWRYLHRLNPLRSSEFPPRL